MNKPTAMVYNGIVGTTKSRAGNLGAEGLVPGDGLLITGEAGGTFRVWIDRPSSFLTGKTAILDHGTPLIVVSGDPRTIGVVAMDPLGRKFIVTNIDIIVGIVTVLSRSGNVTEQEQQ